MRQLLTFTLLRNLFIRGSHDLGYHFGHFQKTYFHLLTVGTLAISTLFISSDSVGQDILRYKVIYNGKNIGWVHLEKNSTGNKLNLLLTSEVTTRIVFPIKVFTKELSTFENGKLIYSSLIRKTNGNTREEKQIKFNGDIYEVTENGQKEKLSDSLINHNLLSLYFKEPTTLKSVFYDKKQCFIKVSKCQDGGYETKFSKGSSNHFYYNKDGMCTKVKVEHLFYNAEIIFVP